MAGKGRQGSLEERAAKAIRSASKPAKGAPRSKRPGANDCPARRRYWETHRLREHKVKALMRHNGMTRAEATTFWVAARGGRRMK